MILTLVLFRNAPFSSTSSLEPEIIFYPGKYLATNFERLKIVPKMSYSNFNGIFFKKNIFNNIFSLYIISII
jgi:hypothetical protein